MRWDGGTLTPLGFLPGGGAHSEAHATSADASVVVGWSDSANTPTAPGREAFVLTPGGISGLGDFSGGNFFSEALGVSGDGSVVAGYGTDADGRKAFRWAGAGLEPLGDLLGGGIESIALDVSADGSVIVGWAESVIGTEAFRWEGGNLQGLGTLGGSSSSVATAVSADGRVIVGRSLGAFIWNRENGMRSLNSVAESEYGLDLEGWSLFPGGISDDGRRIVGTALREDPDSFEVVTAPFLLVIPEPSTALLAGLGLVALGLRRNSRPEDPAHSDAGRSSRR